jgi:hypothetical protein
MPNCARFYQLYVVWSEAEQTLKLIEDRAEVRAERDDALLRVRGHAEVCPDCIAALFEPFCETVDKRKIMLSIGEIAS